MVRTVEEDLEDYVWGKCKEQEYLERVVRCDEFTAANILRKVSQIDETLNRQLRKGVEENLSRLLEQTTALEALDSTQRSVHSEMNEVYENCDKFAKTLDSLLCDYREMVTKLERLVLERNLTADAIRCEELMDSLDKRHEIVKRSEIICEVKGIVADNPDLLSITWLRDTLTTRLKAAENELTSAIEEEIKRVEWDVDLRAEMQRNTQKCLDMVAKRLETEVNFDSENLLLGDRLRSDQIKNYHLLEIVNNLAARWPLQAKSLLVFEQESVSTIMNAIRESIFTITASMHREMNSSKGVSPYMQELLAYIGRIELHFSHFPGTIRHTSALSSIADYIVQLFIVNATLVRPLTDCVREQLYTDLEKLLDALDSKLTSSLKYPNRDQLLALFSSEKSILSYNIDEDGALPAWVYIHALIAMSPDTLVSPHTSVEWPIEQYVKFCCEHPDLEIISFLNGLMTSYTASVINRHETQYVPQYPQIMDLIKKGTEKFT
ncbi:hypothetical protein OESDEN_02556 [Oesophagostomum dentatum]|uniref:Uncharacterized protein n=1 Tax=Oesophagostomum dentatum TaxID=61180 RepID=A0A0B1TPX9_OESDE|nr:hypothetical protein OESDEN_02556 [Oesophagostomum dentatum]